MADAPAEDPAFDPSLKKKKKKKKKAAEDGAEDADAAAPAEEAAAASAADGEAGGFEAAKKKKKKKPKAADGSDDDADFGTFNATKKKKKPKKVDESVDADASAAAEAATSSGDVGDSSAESHAPASGSNAAAPAKPKKDAPAWHGSDRPYEYDELLQRILGMLNPDISERKAFRMKPPEVVMDGTKKVVLVNFPEICNAMNRHPDHVLSFMLAEMGTSGSLDGTSRVTFKGRFKPKQIESIIRQYVKEYVLCKLCKSSDTKLNKDQATRLYFMVCNTCSAHRSVNPIKSGFQAQIGKRKKKP
jgi:translation initiation factor 2 subunit 2